MRVGSESIDLGNIQSQRTRAILTVQSEIRRSMSDFLRKDGFIEIAPVIISPLTDPLNHPVDGAKIDYCGHGYQLTRSMIFHKQIALLATGKIFVFSPNVRLEPPELRETGMHLVEFTQLDLEVRDATREAVMSLGERLIVRVLGDAAERCGPELEFLGRKLGVPQIPFDRIVYADALDAGGFSILSRERKEPLWVIDFPIDGREFYDREDPKRPGILNDMDLVYSEGYGEALSGGERENTYDRVLPRIKRSGLSPADFKPYLAILREGLPPSAGFGVGIERLTRFICGLKRIEEATLFPKAPGMFEL